MQSSEDRQIGRAEEYACRMRKHALKMALAAGGHASHFGAGMSLVDILAVLFSTHLYLPSRTGADWTKRDRFILSKGHGVLGYYAALAEKGWISEDDLASFENNGSYLLGHPVRDEEHGIEFSTGSLGMGLSLGVGLAVGAKKKAAAHRVYVLMGDGECAEGSVWEAAMAAAHFSLDNLTAIVDRNGLQLGGKTTEVMDSSDLGEKFRSFGWKVTEVDGHDIRQIDRAFREARETGGRPGVILANTVKGRGFSFSENNNAWHHAVMTEKQYAEALQELEAAYDHD